MTQAEEIKQLKKENEALREALRSARDYLLQVESKQKDILARLHLNAAHLPMRDDG